MTTETKVERVRAHHVERAARIIEDWLVQDKAPESLRRHLAVFAEKVFGQGIEECVRRIQSYIDAIAVSEKTRPSGTGFGRQLSDIADQIPKWAREEHLAHQQVRREMPPESSPRSSKPKPSSRRTTARAPPSAPDTPVSRRGPDATSGSPAEDRMNLFPLLALVHNIQGGARSTYPGAVCVDFLPPDTLLLETRDPVERVLAFYRSKGTPDAPPLERQAEGSFVEIEYRQGIYSMSVRIVRLPDGTSIKHTATLRDAT